jgi:hypothetical protein
MTNSETDSLTAPASQAPNRAVSHPYNLIIRFKLTDTIPMCSLNDFLASKSAVYVSTGGAVDLVKLELSYVLTEAPVTISAGFRPTGSSIDIDRASMNESGHTATANAFTVGIKNLVTLVPEDSLSRRCKPADSGLLMLDFGVELSDKDKIRAHLFFYLHSSAPFTESI